MSNFVLFDPSKHKAGITLWEEYGVKIGDIIEIKLTESDMPYEAAVLAPWFYLVEVEDDDAA